MFNTLINNFLFFSKIKFKNYSNLAFFFFFFIIFQIVFFFIFFIFHINLFFYFFLKINSLNQLLYGFLLLFISNTFGSVNNSFCLIFKSLYIHFLGNYKSIFIFFNYFINFLYELSYIFYLFLKYKLNLSYLCPFITYLKLRDGINYVYLFSINY